MMQATRPLCLITLLQVAFFFPAGAHAFAGECGIASVYASTSEATASGQDTNADDLTAAHRSLRFGTMVTVDNRENGRSATVRITDRGPFVAGRIIDISQIAARKLGISGLTQVCLSIFSSPAGSPPVE